jgi:hypothetical protein
MICNPIKIITPIILLFLLVSEGSHAAVTRPAEIESILIVPTETRVGSHPEITGRVKANAVPAKGEAIEIIVIATVVRPDNVLKSWTWKNIRMKEGDIRSFSVPKEYQIKSTGTYKVDFNIYSRKMQPIHKRSKKFMVSDTAIAPEKAQLPEKVGARAEEQAARHAAFQPAEYRQFGVGVYANVLHLSGGATMLVWPLKYVGLQGSYTGGLNTIAEGRLLLRFPLSLGVNPYLGAGYMIVETERSVEEIGIKQKFKDSGMSGVVGAEIPFNKRWFGYLEVCGAAISLKKEVTNGGVSGTATVKYAPVSVGIGIVYYLF